MCVNHRERLGFDKLVCHSNGVCVGLETFKQQLEVGQAGDQLGVLVRGVKREDVRRGMILCPSGSVDSHTQLKGQVYEREEMV